MMIQSTTLTGSVRQDDERPAIPCAWWIVQMNLYEPGDGAVNVVEVVAPARASGTLSAGKPDTARSCGAPPPLCIRMTLTVPG